MQIKAENLTYVYDEKTASLAVKALKDVTLTIKEGEFFGIVGHTGSGKTTFVQHLNGLIKLGKNKGSLIIGEFNLGDKKCDYRGLRAKLGMVFQYPEYQLFEETVEKDVAFALKNFFPDMDEVEKQNRVSEALSLVGLNYKEIKDKSPFDFSGGQKRRIAIAGTIVARPEVLVLDEPVAGLDPEGKKDFLRLLKTLHQSYIKTIVIVSHDMNVISEYCDRVGVFYKGELASVGTPKEIFSNSELIEKCNLDLPLTAYLEKELKDSGLEIDSDYTVNDFIDKTASAFTLQNRGDTV